MDVVGGDELVADVDLVDVDDGGDDDDCDDDACLVTLLRRCWTFPLFIEEGVGEEEEDDDDDKFEDG